ncbi:MAG: hypothetical protein R3301_08720 [Saprospiraceae bacterium]|nr:hypothetical protein [Saprospiraceae bacterium]
MRLPLFITCIICCTSLLFTACGKDDPPPPGCDGSLSATVVATGDAGCGMSNGSITVDASGGTAPYMFQLDGGMAQSGATFTGVGQGMHTITVRDANNCTTNVDADVSTGTVFADVQAIFMTNCAISGCHNGDEPSIPNFTSEATIRQNAAGIKARTGSREMPPAGQDPLSDAEIALIACWVDDGAN